MRNWIYEMRYKSNSSAYRIFTLIPDEYGRPELISTRTGVAREGNMDTERFLKQYCNSVDLVGALVNEKWSHNIPKTSALKKLETWRKGCRRAGLDKVLRWKGDEIGRAHV